MSVFPATAAAKSAGRNRASASGARPGFRNQRVAYWYIAPLGIGFAVFYFWPLLQTFYYSFTEFGAFGGHTFIGTDNYVRVVKDVTVWQALGNTLIYSVIGLMALPVAIVVASLLNRRGLRGVSVYRALYFVPFVTLPVAVGLVWNWLYNGDFGLINEILSWIGVDGRYWVSDPSTAVYAIGAVIVWSTTGYYLVIFMAGIKGIPRDYYEAAELDGAGALRRFFTITLPLLSPTIFFASVICMINSLQTFDLIYIMMGESNPAIGDTQSVVGLFYKWAFVENAQGAAAALAFLLMLVIAALTYLQFRIQKRWVHYA
ncbi:carbohydrate ABC transporter permease [Streptomyces sp. NPDC029674]|uniref:carbohydrate ABC transporter permease n=1 Tax=Streptomyces sp. NPDC029674 TaxID=3365297 RepID=UPI003850D599